MKVIIFGAGGRTGKLVVNDALDAGHEVTAFVHEAEQFDPRVQVVVGDATDRQAVEQALAGQQAVIDTIGGTTPYKNSGLETSTARIIVAGMVRRGVRRLVVISALGVGDSVDETPFWYEYLLMPTMLRGVVKDKAGMEDEVRRSDLDYVIVRPGLLSDDEPSGPLRIVGDGEKGRSTSRRDLARFLVKQLASDAHVGQAVVVVNS